MDSPFCWFIKLVIAAILLAKFFRAAYKELEERKEECEKKCLEYEAAYKELEERKTECEKEWIEYEENFKNKEDI